MNDMSSKPCTVQEESPCPSCPLTDKIHCKWSQKVLNGFFAISFPTFLGIFILLIMFYDLSGHWWPIPGYILLVIIVFTYEFKFLCSHCPYYAGDGKFIKCIANNGAPKIWKYNPGPMTGTEKNLMKMLVTLFYVIIPVITSIAVLYIIFTGQYETITKAGAVGVVILTFWGSWSFLTVLKTFYCSMCVNFSCPLNTVDKTIVDDYLRKNDVMREAWEKSGYKLD